MLRVGRVTGWRGILPRRKTNRVFKVTQGRTKVPPDIMKFLSAEDENN
jgi:hypothetical protein